MRWFYSLLEQRRYFAIEHFDLIALDRDTRDFDEATVVEVFVQGFTHLLFELAIYAGRVRDQYPFVIDFVSRNQRVDSIDQLLSRGLRQIEARRIEGGCACGNLVVWDYVSQHGLGCGRL